MYNDGASRFWSDPLAVNQTIDRRSIDRRLFGAAAIIFPLVVIAGFARTYYLKVFFHTPQLATTMVHLHGILMTTWIALFIAQVRLISSRQIRTHQRLGFAAIGIAILILLVGFLIAVRAAKFGAVRIEWIHSQRQCTCRSTENNRYDGVFYR